MDPGGRTVLLTGASGGIGRAIAQALHARGASLIVTARRAEVLDDLQHELGAERVEVVAADLSEREGVARLADRADELDIFVANAALPASGRLEGFSPEEIDRALDVNLRAPIQLARAFVPRMLERRSGHMVFVSSLAGKVVSARSSLYSATKFGLRAFAAGLREDLHGSGVGVTTVFPGFIRGAGMFADSGVRLPVGVGTRTAAEVADAVVRGVEQGKAEIDVAPLGLRAGALVSALAPNLAATVQRRLGSTAIGDAVAAGQADKR